MEGCNRFCDFCGLRSIRSGPGAYKYMSLAVAEAAAAGAARLCPTARFEFAVHGEPLQHPRHAVLLGAFRSALPHAQMQVTTNGKVLLGRMKKGLEVLFDAGVDFVVLDTYEPERLALQAEAFALHGVDGMQVLDFYRDLAPKGWSPWHNHKRRVQRSVVVMDDLGARSGEVASRVITNHAGNNLQIGPLPEPLAKTCTLPFRELTVSWDGGVQLCCNDWGHEYTCGNVLESGMESIWRGPAMQAARNVLYARNRGFSPCVGCNIGSGSRPGLLPEQPMPSTTDLRTIEATLRASTPQNGRGGLVHPSLRALVQ